MLGTKAKQMMKTNRKSNVYQYTPQKRIGVRGGRRKGWGEQNPREMNLGIGCGWNN